MPNLIHLTAEARRSAKEAGRRKAVGMPGAMAEAFAEIAEAGAVAAIRVQPATLDQRGVPRHVREAAARRHSKGRWQYGKRILWEKSHVDDRTFARLCVNYVLDLIEAEGASPTPAGITGDLPGDAGEPA